MTNRIYTVAILGAGVRGANVYGEIIKNSPNMFKIEAICDTDKQRLEKAGKKFKGGEQLVYAEKIGIGSRKYELIEI